MIKRLRGFVSTYSPSGLLTLAGALVLAAAAGAFAAVALGTGTQAPVSTVTINAGATGEQGPAGPAGPPGPAGPSGSPGAESCPTGYEFAAVVFNTPGGHTQIATCVLK